MGIKTIIGNNRRLTFLEILMDIRGHRFKEIQKQVGNTMTDKLSKEFEKNGFILIEQGDYKITAKGIVEYHRLNTLKEQGNIKDRDAVAINHNNTHFTASTSIPIKQKEAFEEKFSKWVEKGNELFSEFGLPCGSVMGVYTKHKVASLEEK